MKKLLITKNLVEKIQDLVVNQELRHVKSNPDVDHFFIVQNSIVQWSLKAPLGNMLLNKSTNTITW